MDDTICYINNYIKEVHFKIDFLEPIKELQSTVISPELHSAIISKFPIQEPQIGVTHDVAINATNVVSQSQQFQQWIYHGYQREKTLNVNSHFISLVMKSYRTYADFKDCVGTPLKALGDLFGNNKAIRIGMRFVNIYDFLKHANESRKYFADGISGYIPKSGELMNASRMMLLQEFVSDDIRVRIQSGLFNPDYPAKIIRPHYVLDIDAFIESIDDICNHAAKIDVIHDKIQTTFENSITDKLRGLLNVK